MADVTVARVAIAYEGDVVEGDVVADPERFLTGPQVAAILRINPATWRSLVRSGHAPKADDPGVGPINRRTPRWRVGTIAEFKRTRPGRGARTDLKRK